MTMQCEYLIIGAGPAGLQLGYFLQQAKRDYLILEAGPSAGTFFRRFPRHRRLISINKVYTGYEQREVNLRWDWNSLLSDSDEMLFKNYTHEYFPDADVLANYLQDYATYFRLQVKYNTRVTNVTKESGFLIRDQAGRYYRCQRLIVATGFSQPYLPDVPGIELAEKYTEVSINPGDFINQRVLVIGKGNSGFETADNLISTAALIHVASPTPVSMAWKTKFVGHLRAINNNFLDTYQLKSQNAMLNAAVIKIERRGGKYAVTFAYSLANGEVEEIVYDRVILCTGWRFDASIFDERCRPALVYNDKLPDQTSGWQSINVRDLYFAGTLMQMRDYKKKQSGFIHGFRYNVQALHHIFEQKYHGNDWPRRSIKATPERLMEEVIRRTNESSALWQQTGFLCDLISICNDGQALYYEDIPRDYINDSTFGKSEDYYVVTLEFGQDIINANPDPMTMTRIHKDDYGSASLSTFIHPIVRRYKGATKVSEHHIIEDLASEWLEEVHTRPLLAYFEKELHANGWFKPLPAARVAESTL